MKTSSALITLCAFCALPGRADEPHGDPYIPVGTLKVDKTWARTGIRPTITWNIHYPENIDDILEITPTDKIVPKQRTKMEVPVVGAAFQVGSNHTPLSVHTRVGRGNSWERIFLGPDYTVTQRSSPSTLPLRERAEAGSQGPVVQMTPVELPAPLPKDARATDPC
jgi:hypothetical protein